MNIMLDSIEKARDELEEQIKALESDLKLILKEEPMSEQKSDTAPSPGSELVNTLNAFGDRLRRTCRLVVSLRERIDIPE